MRDSVSNWIVSGTGDPNDILDETSCSVAYPVNLYASGNALFNHALRTDIDNEPIYSPQTDLDPFFCTSLAGKKRTSSLNFSVDKLTVAPSEIFSQVFDNIREELNTSIPPPPMVPVAAPVLEPQPQPVSRKTPRKHSQEPPLKKRKIHQEEPELVEQVTPTYKRSGPKKARTYNINYQITFGKRANGNQQWDIGCLAPPKIGKMRRMTFKLTCEGKDLPSGLTLTARCVDQMPGKHRGKLVLCTNDRCCEKKKVEGSRKAVTECEQRLNELTVPVNFAEGKCVVEFYLKPEWNGMGENKLRPPFEIVVDLNLPNGEAICLDSWTTELQSHKFESSTKGKAMEASGSVSKSERVSVIV